ncbi:MAG: peptidyl-prolyl cis-trans isomerase [Bryobacteraceae bacterium]|nr:peptidyl-prolyl cis-trans isomerase [Bryobacteraceae bacterium]MDW8378336.1 peptidyl-prolyl cis-trans isomerase [Bryobacterales bacterium]
MSLKVILGLAACGALLRGADIVVIEEIIAKVNGDIITRTEIERSRRALEADLRQQGLTGVQLQRALKEREPSLLRDRIDQLLLVNKAKELNINVDSEISRRLAEIQKQLNEPDTDKFQRIVREQTGMSFEDYKNDMRNAMLTERVIRQEVGSQINISRAEVQKYYEEHKAEFVREEKIYLREILLSTEGKDEQAVAQLEKKAKDLVARARKGERFAELARDNSDSKSAQDGGFIDGYKRGELSPQIEALVWDKGRNHVTDPIRLPNGFLILKVEEQHKAGQAPLEEVEGEIQNRLYMPKFQPKIREYLTALRESAFLEIKPGWVDTGAAPGKDTTWKDPAQLKPETITKEEVAAQPRRKRLLWLVPIPGTKKSSSSSKTVKM